MSIRVVVYSNVVSLWYVFGLDCCLVFYWLLVQLVIISFNGYSLRQFQVQFEVVYVQYVVYVGVSASLVLERDSIVSFSIVLEVV